MSEKFATVGELVKYLQKFDASRPLIVDDDGDTWEVDREMIRPWGGEDGPNDPIAIFIGFGDFELEEY